MKSTLFYLENSSAADVCTKPLAILLIYFRIEGRMHSLAITSNKNDLDTN
jgi:hypothetical protein